MNLTPLLDVIFILLFFFLVATTLREDENRLEVTLPQASSDASPSRDETIQVSLTAEGLIYIGEEEIAPAEIESRLGALIRENPERPVEIFSDAEAQMQPFVNVAAACSRLGVSFDLRTAPPGEGATP